MNKNFEEAYKKYSDIDTPDLWSRIEAGIDALEEKQNTLDTNKTITSEDITESTGKDNPNTVNNTHNTKVTKRFILSRPYIGIAAAAACLILVVSATRALSTNTGTAPAEAANYIAAGDATASDAATSESATECTNDEAAAADAYYEEASETSILADYPQAEAYEEASECEDSAPIEDNGTNSMAIAENSESTNDALKGIDHAASAKRDVATESEDASISLSVTLCSVDENICIFRILEDSDGYVMGETIRVYVADNASLDKIMELSADNEDSFTINIIPAYLDDYDFILDNVTE